jgi:hypothetical protein
MLHGDRDRSVGFHSGTVGVTHSSVVCWRCCRLGGVLDGRIECETRSAKIMYEEKAAEYSIGCHALLEGTYAYFVLVA